jgi:guanylate kinase
VRVMGLRPEALSVIILPPSWEELERRIRSRALDGEDSISVRLLNARDELGYAPRYKFQVVNDNLDRAIAELEDIVA